MKTWYYIIGFLCICILLRIAFTMLGDSDSKGGSSKEKDEPIIEISVTGSDGKVYTNYQDACSNGDFIAAYQYIERLTEYKEKNGLYIDYEANENDKDYVFKAEMLFLASQNTEEASNRILFLLAEYQIPGTPTSPGNEYSGQKYYDAQRYISGIVRYNNRCKSVLDMAIAQGDEKLARRAVALIKQNVDIEKSNPLTISSKGFNNTDIDLAKKKLEEAIKSGVFK